MSDEVILSFEDVNVAAEPPYEVGLEGGSFSLKAAELMVVRMEEEMARTPFADAAEGLAEPASGRVAFLGEDWRAMPPQRSSECRGRIGRVFVTHSWISNLDVDENVTLAQRSHTLRPESEIAAEAAALARQFGFGELPRGRPAVVRRADLRRAEWVRAFIGEPALLILENPMQDVSSDFLPCLAGAVKAARARGAAVVWLSGNARILQQIAPEASLRFQFKGAKLVPWEGK